MADSKISALSDGGALQAADVLVVARSGANDKILGSGVPGYEFDYVERTTNLSVSATTAAGADTFIDGNSITFDGSTIVLVEFSAPLADSSVFLSVSLWDGTTDLGVIVQSNGVTAGLRGARRLTPSAGAHTFHIKAWRGATSATVQAAAGGAGTRVPAFYRVTRVA
jgi:hypothetical protein